MRKPTWWDLGIAVLGLVLVCSAAQGVAQTQDPEGSVGDVTQDSRITGTSDGLGSDQGLVTDDPAQQTGTGGSGVGQGTGTGQGTTGTGQTTTGTGQGTGGTGQATGTEPQSQVEAQQRVEIARLRAQVASLEQQLAQMRVQLARAQDATQQGTGGGGNVGIGDPNAEAPEGATGVGYPTAEGVGGGGTAGATADTDDEGVAVANVIHTGRVRSVNSQRLVLEEEGGGSNTLPLARDVRVTRNGRQLALRNLSEGALVRASADLYARGNPVTSIEVLSSPE